MAHHLVERPFRERMRAWPQALPHRTRMAALNITG
jgi:hypothetical protein